VCRDTGVENERDAEVYVKVCGHCSTFVNVKRCAHCGKAWYCSRACQRADWKAHKQLVPEMAAEKQRA
jgi:splicing suppressor protein 51